MTTGKYKFYKIEDRRYKGLCRGLSTMLKFLRVLRTQNMRNITVNESTDYYTVKFSSEVTE